MNTDTENILVIWGVGGGQNWWRWSNVYKLPLINSRGVMYSLVTIVNSIGLYNWKSLRVYLKFSSQEKDCSCVWWWILTFVVIISQYIHTSNHNPEYLKFTQCYMPIIAEWSWGWGENYTHILCQHQHKSPAFAIVLYLYKL